MMDAKRCSNLPVACREGVGRRTGRRNWVAGLLAVVSLSVASAADAPSPEGPVVRLSPYEVSASSVDFRNWRRVSTAHFTIYTDARAKAADAVLRQFEMLHTMAQQYFRRTAVR